MRLSQFHLRTVKETPADAEIASHQLMLKAGMLRKLAAGLYTWSPLGLRVLRKVEAIVREEMNAAGAIELLMPTIQPRELWEETGRWQKFGGQLLKIRDRKQAEYCYGPTAEEVITDFARNELASYKQLPVNFYNIQAKFRDEIRPRFGVMRAREFLMKDAYSFHLDDDSLAAEYRNMYDTYGRIFTRLGLKFRAVFADTGAIGGSASHEFHVLADSGEDAIAFSDGSDYAANVELAEALAPGARPAAAEAMRKVDTPVQKTCEDVAALLGIALQRTVKSVALVGDDATGFVLALVRGDQRSQSIAAASIVAKVHRDRLMDELARQYPEYGFERHKGYCTPEHQDAIRRLGPCTIHRKSFTFIRELRGEYSALFYDLKQRLFAAAAAAELQAIEHELDASRGALAESEQRKLRLTLSRRWRAL